MAAPGGRFTATNMPLRFLIRFVYEVQEFQLVGGPAWVEWERFDFEAAAGRETKPPEMRQMIRALLAERFSLQVREETREMPIYALVLARRDGRLGPKLSPSAGPCASPLGAIGRAEPPPAPSPSSSAPAAPQLPCGIHVSQGQLTGGSALLSMLALTLAPISGRIVQDKTGLSGPFDFELTWTPEMPASPADTQQRRRTPVAARSSRRYRNSLG